MMDRDLLLNGRDTGPLGLVISPIRAKASSWFGASSEYNLTNNWIVNFGSGNCNNTNKNNSNLARAVAALDQQVLIGWIEAFEDCCLHKMSSVDCIMYRLTSTLDLVILAVEVTGTHEYYPGTSICFLVIYPRIREIFAAAFRDRIVQHWICIRLVPLFEERHRSLGDVTFNCRPGFGTIAASERAAAYTAELTQNYTIPGVVSTMDIWSFFTTIDKDATWLLLRVFILENRETILESFPDTNFDTFLWVCEIVVKHCPQDDCEMRGDQRARDKLAPWKSLLNALKHIGMAIGNITSQELANFILSFVDEWAVAFCAARNMRYVRFVDDIFLAALRAQDVLDFRAGLIILLQEKLHQKLHPNKFYIQPATHGIKFVGRVIKPGRVYTGNRTVGNFYDAMHTLDDFCCIMDKTGVTVDAAIQLEHLTASINSLFGFLIHTASYNIRMKGINSLRHFWKYCYILNGHIAKIRKKYQLKTIITELRDEENCYYAAIDSGDRTQLFPPKNPHNKHRRRGTRRRDL